jgi:hypothetical protein
MSFQFVFRLILQATRQRPGGAAAAAGGSFLIAPSPACWSAAVDGAPCRHGPPRDQYDRGAVGLIMVTDERRDVGQLAGSVVIHQPVMVKDPEVNRFDRDAEFHDSSERSRPIYSSGTGATLRCCWIATGTPVRSRGADHRATNQPAVARQIGTGSILDRGLASSGLPSGTARMVLPDPAAPVGDPVGVIDAPRRGWDSVTLQAKSAIGLKPSA